MRTPRTRPESIVDISFSVMRHRSNKEVTQDDILLELSKIFDAEPEFVKVKCRQMEMVKLRLIYFYVASIIFYKKISLKEIGQFMGGRDHTTVLNARNNMKGYIDGEDPYIWDDWCKYVNNSIICRNYNIQ